MGIIGYHMMDENLDPEIEEMMIKIFLEKDIWVELPYTTKYLIGVRMFGFCTNINEISRKEFVSYL